MAKPARAMSDRVRCVRPPEKETPCRASPLSRTSVDVVTIRPHVGLASIGPDQAATKPTPEEDLVGAQTVLREEYAQKQVGDSEIRQFTRADALKRGSLIH